MSKFKYNPEDFQKAVEWSKTIIIEDGKVGRNTLTSMMS